MGIRRSVADLNNNERVDFVNAVIGVKANLVAARGGGQMSEYDQFVAIHLGVTSRTIASSNENIGDGGHGNAAFCPWHREYLRRFELALQAQNPKVTLPFWDWTDTHATREIVFADSFLGGSGGVDQSGNFSPDDSELVGQEVQTGPFSTTAAWPVRNELHVQSITDLALQFGTRLRRNVQPFENLPSAGNITRILQNTLFSGFRPALESGPRVHGFIHGWVGGSMNWMSSPNDPVFSSGCYFTYNCFLK